MLARAALQHEHPLCVCCGCPLCAQPTTGRGERRALFWPAMRPAPSRMPSTGRRVPLSRGDAAGSLSTVPTRYSSMVCMGPHTTHHQKGCIAYPQHVCSLRAAPRFGSVPGMGLWNEHTPHSQMPAASYDASTSVVGSPVVAILRELRGVHNDSMLAARVCRASWRQVKPHLPLVLGIAVELLPAGHV